MPDLGPDPHLNGHGVSLTGRERRVFVVVAAAVIGTVVLVLVGLMNGFPGLVDGARGTATVRVVGSGRALVSVERPGEPAVRREVALPFTQPVADGAVQVAASPLPGSTGLGCVVTDEHGAVVQREGPSAGGLVRCSAQP